MQIVIEIPKYIYDTIIAYDGYVSDCDNEKVGNAIKNGTPLPEWHGRLIDADALVDSLSSSDRDIYCKAIIEEDAPTIIEADKESEG